LSTTPALLVGVRTKAIWRSRRIAFIGRIAVRTGSASTAAGTSVLALEWPVGMIARRTNIPSNTIAITVAPISRATGHGNPDEER
jgi:hypothetical protein